MKRAFTVAICLLCLFSLTACQTYEDFADAFLRDEPVKETIRIGVFQPQSGSYKEQGALEIEGIELAHQKRPSVLGKDVELVYVDNNSDIGYAKQAAREIVEEDVSIVIGSYNSAISVAAGEVFLEEKQPAIAATNVNPIVTEACEYYFRTCFVESFQGQAVAGYATEQLGASHAAILMPGESDDASTMGKEFTAHFETQGGSIVARPTYASDSDDYVAQLEEIQGSEADVVFLLSEPETALKIVEQTVTMGMTAQFLGTSEWESDILLEDDNASASALMAFSTFFDDGAHLTDATEDFLAAYEAEHVGGSPEDAIALAYDAYMIAIEAIERAGTADDRDTIRDELAKIENFEGASGRITFDNNGDPQKSVAILSVNEGKFSPTYTLEPSFD